MLLTNVSISGQPRVVGKDGDRAFDCTRQLGTTSLEEALRVHGGDLPPVNQDLAETVDESDLNFQPLGDAMSRYFCIGFNFAAHASEVERELPEYPTVFMRSSRSFVGHGQPIELPAASVQLDWEGEIGVVIGRSGREIEPDDAHRHIAGYTAVAENSVRDWQLHSTQATAGKNFDATGGIGPWMAPLANLTDFRELQLETRLNGEAMQKGAAADHVFDLPALLAYLSTFTELQPGDVIATGTPPGIGYRRDPQRFLTPGDVLEVEVTGLPVLRHNVVARGLA